MLGRDDKKDSMSTMEQIDLKNPKTKEDFQIVLTGVGKKILEFNTDESVTKILKQQGCLITCLQIKGMSTLQGNEYADEIIKADNPLEIFKHLDSKKFNVILINDLLTFVQDSAKFLNQLTELITSEGCVICSIPNIAYGLNRINLLNGEINYSSIDAHVHPITQSFTLNTILYTLEDNGYSIVELHRITKDVDTSDLDYTISHELLDSILRDPESKTTEYVFKIIPTSNNSDARKWLREFSKVTTSDRLRDLFEYYKNYFGGELLKQTQEKDAHIASMQSAIKEKDAHIASMQSAIKEKDAHIASMQ